MILNTLIRGALARNALRRGLLPVTGALILLASALAPVSADDEPPATPAPTAETESITGVDPEADRDGRPAGYYIGRADDGGIALRTHGPGARHHFTAVLRTDGRFVDIEAIRLELGDSVRVSNDGHTLRYNVHTYDGVDGVTFRVRDGAVLSFHLELNGTLIGTSQIFLGAHGHHPAHNPFRIRL